MEETPEIAYKNFEPTEDIRLEVEKGVRRLEKFFDRITSCHVTITAPMHQRRGGLYEVSIRVALPDHKDVIVTASHDDKPEREHPTVAVREAFAAAQRQIEDAVREMRSAARPH